MDVVLPPVYGAPLIVTPGVDAAPAAENVLAAENVCAPFSNAKFETATPLSATRFDVVLIKSPDVMPEVAVVPAVMVDEPPDGVAHVPSPRQNVLDDADVPPLRLPTGKLPVTSLPRRTVRVFDAPAIVLLVSVCVAAKSATVSVAVGMVLPFTDVGVIAPSVRLIAGVDVAVATVPETPFAVVTETLVTVPALPGIWTRL